MKGKEKRDRKERSKREIGRRLHQTLPSVRRARVTGRQTFGNGTATPFEAWDERSGGIYVLWHERPTITPRTRRRAYSGSPRHACARCFAPGSWKASGGLSAWRGRRDRGEFRPAPCVLTRKAGKPSTTPRPSPCHAKRLTRSLRRINPRTAGGSRTPPRRPQSASPRG